MCHSARAGAYGPGLPNQIRGGGMRGTPPQSNAAPECVPAGRSRGIGPAVDADRTGAAPAGIEFKRGYPASADGRNERVAGYWRNAAAITLVSVSLHHNGRFHRGMQRANVRERPLGLQFETPRRAALNSAGVKSARCRHRVRKGILVHPDYGVSNLCMNCRRCELDGVDRHFMDHRLFDGVRAPRAGEAAP